MTGFNREKLQKKVKQTIISFNWRLDFIYSSQLTKNPVIHIDMEPGIVFPDIYICLILMAGNT